MIKTLLGALSGGGQAPSSAFMGRVPAGVRVYAVGDIHGRNDLLLEMIARVVDDCAGYHGTVKVVFIGDVIDRGPNSADVVETLLHRLPTCWQTVFLRGNHERAMLDFLRDPEGSPAWLAWGGRQALESYGIGLYDGRGARAPALLAADFAKELERRGHNRLFDEMQPYHVEGSYLFVHAGVRPKIALEKQMEDDLLFIREDFLAKPHGLPYVVVFGHTILPEPLLLDDRIGLDTGAFESGILTAIKLDNDQRTVLQVVPG